jgi:hypothetical protein
MKDTPSRDQKVGVWCPISLNRIIGPIFFDDTVNSERYFEVSLYLLIGRLHEDEIASGHFQQDGATAHTTRVSVTSPRDVFGDRIVSEYIWPPRSPNFTHLDYDLRGAMRGQFTETVLTPCLNGRKPPHI